MVLDQPYIVEVSIDHNILPTIVDTARASAAGTKWATRIEAAYAWLIEQEAVTFGDDDLLHIPSATDPETTYHVSAMTCQCYAFVGGRPCWHRAAARLVERMIEYRLQYQAEQRVWLIERLGAARKRQAQEVAA